MNGCKQRIIFEQTEDKASNPTEDQMSN